jgi:hypothetical protein
MPCPAYDRPLGDHGELLRTVWQILVEWQDPNLCSRVPYVSPGASSLAA